MDPVEVSRSRGRRVVPRLGLTLVMTVFWAVMDAAFGAAALFGSVTGSTTEILAVYALLTVLALGSFGFAAFDLYHGSFLVGGEAVRSGWPRSRWVSAEETDGAFSKGAQAWVRLIDGSEVRIVTVNYTFLATNRAASQIDDAMREIHAALRLGDEGQRFTGE